MRRPNLQTKEVKISYRSVKIPAGDSIIDLPQGAILKDLLTFWESTADLHYEFAMVMDGHKMQTIVTRTQPRIYNEHSTTLAADLPFGGRMRRYSGRLLRIFDMPLGTNPQFHIRVDLPCQLIFRLLMLGH